MKVLILTMVMILTTGISFAGSSKGTSKEGAQVLDFKGLDINSAKGSPGGSFVSSKKNKNFEYFFETKMDFKGKIIESLEGVR